MRFYYTGAKSKLEIQPNIQMSLGGFISSSTIPNDRLNNLFPSISKNRLKDEYSEVIGIALKNESGQDLKNLKFYFDYSANSFSKYLISFIEPNTSLYFEKIQDLYSSPYEASFIEVNGEANKIEVKNNFKKDTYLGLWIKRELTPLSKSYFTDEEMAKRFWEGNSEELSRAEKTKLIFSWD